MNTKTFILIIVTFFVFTSAKQHQAEPKPVFSYKVYGNIASYFENENDLLSFFEFKKDDVVAEVGAGDGQNIGGLSLLTDSITFYVQDINAVRLTQKNVDKVMKRCKKFKTPITNTFHLQIGTEKATLLPDDTFDKIMLIATFHEFTYMDEMITDIKKKLKPNGKLYILESHCFSKQHINYTANETITLLKKHGFSLIKKDGKDLNNSSGLYRAVFGKN